MGTAHSQHSASVRVSPVCGYASKHPAKPVAIHSEGPSTEIVRVTMGSEPYLASSSIRSIYKQAGSSAVGRWNSRRKDYGLTRHETQRLSVNGAVGVSGGGGGGGGGGNGSDSITLDSGAWTRSSSRKRVRTRALKQVSHNSTNSSYIADCSPERSVTTHSDLRGSEDQESFVAVNESQLKGELDRLSSVDVTGSVNGHFNSFHSPSRRRDIFIGDTESGLKSSRLVQRRHLSELCLHLDGLSNNNAIAGTSVINNNGGGRYANHQSPRKFNSRCFVPTIDFGTQTAEVGPFVRMATNTASMYVSKTYPRSPSCQATPARSVPNQGNFNPITHFTRSPLSSEMEEMNAGRRDCGGDTLNTYHDYVNLPQSRSRSVKVTKDPSLQQQPSKTRNGDTYDEGGRIPLPSRRMSKSRWKFMSRGKNLTKSISCYALKFFGQQNRGCETTDQLLINTSQITTSRNPPTVATTRPTTLAMLKRARGDGNIPMQRGTPNPTPNDLGQTLQRVLRLGQSEEGEGVPHVSHVVSLQARMNRSLSAFGNQDGAGNRRPATRRSTFQHSTRESMRRDRITILQTTSTKELLHCLSVFILQQCDNLYGEHSSNSSPLYPEEIIAWIRDIDRALIQQGWTDVPFLSPANVVFLFIMIKGFADSSITCSRELHSLVMVCLYLSYGYMGNEISYPLKPFLNAEIIYSMLHESDPQRFRNINPSDPMSSRNPKVINRFRDAFWDSCLRVLQCKSKEMLQLNSDAVFFTQSVAELRSYGYPQEQNPASSA